MGKGKKQLKRARRAAAAAAEGKPSKQQQSKKAAEEDHGEETELELLGFDDAFAAGLAFEQLGALEAAAEAFAVALKRKPGHLKALTRLADALSASGDHESALERYKEASKAPAGSEDASVWFRLGLAFAALDKDADAVENYKKSLALSKKEVEEGAECAVKAYNVTLAALANCYGEQGDLDSAVRVFRDATTLLPGNGNLHYNLATMLMARAGDAFDKEVVAFLERAIECSPDTVDFYSDLVEYLTQHKQQAGKVKTLQEKIAQLEAAVAKEEATGKKRKRSDEESEQDEDEEEEEEEDEDEDGDDDEEDQDASDDQEEAIDSDGSDE